MTKNPAPHHGGNNHDPPPTPPSSTDNSPPPQGYAIDVRIFLAIITTTMALAFTAGVMLGPTDPALVKPVLTLLGVPYLPPPDYYLVGENAIASRTNAIDSPAGKLSEEALASLGIIGGGGVANPHLLPSTSKKAKESVVLEGEIFADGEVRVFAVADLEEEEDEDEGDAIIQQPRRTKTDHVATLGYKIRETHVNIDTPVLEGSGEVPYERDINSINISTEELGKEDSATILRDQDSPSGQHLLVDIKNLEAAFLNSESRLAEAMSNTVDAGGLTMLSYHCHSLQPAGVSCVGVLLESHISFHTWPDEGVITLDLFTTSVKPLLPLLPKIEELFGIARVNATTGEKEEIVTLWSHELRGFRTEDERQKHYLDDESDLANWVTSPLEAVYKKQIVSVKSEFQQIDIWDVVEREEWPSYEDGLRLGLKPGDSRWWMNEYVTPTRELFLDGVLQSLSDSEHEYHETLVHPPMFAHPSPKSVAIIGGGEGATLREVLRHRTVEKATMIEIDKMMVEIAMEYLPAMSNCSDIVGSAPSCFDDKRTDLIIDNAFAYFIDKFGSKAKDEDKGSAFDVLIVDALDPEEQDDITDHLYNDVEFLNSLVDSLTPQGVLSIQVGTAPSIHDPRADKGVYRYRELLINHLEANPKIGPIFIYEEAHCGFFEPHSFLVACRDVSCRKHWYAETDEVDYQIYERIGGTVSKAPSLVHFDGATQRSYQMPPRAWETIFCRREPEPFECAYRGLDLTKSLFEFDPEDEEASAFEVRSIPNEETGKDETAVYAKDDIPEGSYIMPSHLAASFEVSDDSMENVRKNTQIEGTGSVTVIEDFVAFVEKHGHKSLQMGSGKNFVEIGGSLLMRTADDAKKANVRRWIPVHPDGGRPKFSPVYDRHRHAFDVFLVASRDIKKGEEVMKPEGLWDY